MTKKAKALCIIPARGGSKRIPRKNILPLNGIPLISYSIRSAKEAGVFDKIIVSTDDAEIKAVALQEGVDVDDRPEAMAGDRVTKVQVIKEYLERRGHEEHFDIVAAVLPTCPFRSPEDVRTAYERFVNQDKYEFLIGVVEYAFPIQFALSLDEHQVATMETPEGYQQTRSQDKRKMYHPNGSIYMATVPAFQRKGTFFNETMLTHEMPALRSFDIDYPEQFEMAEIIAQKLSS
ncbi:MAG: cytidylyltransferase domain-containing protein [Salibacteraceae bacterium]